MFMTKEKLYIS